MHLTERASMVEVRTCPCGSSMALRLAADDVAPASSPCEVAVLQRIFVVERDPHVRRLVLHFIGSAFIVDFFDDGYTALDRARRAPPAALVAEVMTPRLDGLSLCRLLRNEPRTAHVPVLLFSVLDARERAAQAGADAFLAKPLDKDRFVAALLCLVEPSHARPPAGSPPGGPA
jgi:CheY-like chemotaxis protein